MSVTERAWCYYRDIVHTVYRRFGRVVELAHGASQIRRRERNRDTGLIRDGGDIVGREGWAIPKSRNGVLADVAGPG